MADSGIDCGGGSVDLGTDARCEAAGVAEAFFLGARNSLVNRLAAGPFLVAGIGDALLWKLMPRGRQQALKRNRARWLGSHEPGGFSLSGRW